MGEIPGGVGDRVTGLKVIDDVVDINRVGLGQRLAVVRVGPEVIDVGGVAALDVRTELLVDRVGKVRLLIRLEKKSAKPNARNDWTSESVAHL
jgi:hypothetical protein